MSTDVAGFFVFSLFFSDFVCVIPSVVGVINQGFSIKCTRTSSSVKEPAMLKDVASLPQKGLAVYDALSLASTKMKINDRSAFSGM